MHDVSANIQDMIDEHFKITADTLGTASGSCALCGASFMVTVPNDASALPALEMMFKKHLADKHCDSGRHV